MSLTISLSEGPNIKGLANDRAPLYVGFLYTSESLLWHVLEGKTGSTPKSYRIHIGYSDCLEEATLTNFEYAPAETIISFVWQKKHCRLIISNTTPHGRRVYGSVDEAVDTVYNLFGEKSATSLMPTGCDEYFKN